MSGHVRINDVTFDEPDDRAVIWRGSADVDSPASGQDEGRLLIQMDVDGQWDIVSADLGRSGDLASLDRCIDILLRLRTRLADLYQGSDNPGSCFEQNGWGRCYEQFGHAGAHSFPSEAHARALVLARVGAKEEVVAS